MRIYPEVLFPLALTVAATFIAWRQWRHLRWLFVAAVVYVARQYAVSVAPELTGHTLDDKSYWVDSRGPAQRRDP